MSLIIRIRECCVQVSSCMRTCVHGRITPGLTLISSEVDRAMAIHVAAGWSEAGAQKLIDDVDVRDRSATGRVVLTEPNPFQT